MDDETNFRVQHDPDYQPGENHLHKPHLWRRVAVIYGSLAISIVLAGAALGWLFE